MQVYLPTCPHYILFFIEFNLSSPSFPLILLYDQTEPSSYYTPLLQMRIDPRVRGRRHAREDSRRARGRPLAAAAAAAAVAVGGGRGTGTGGGRGLLELLEGLLAQERLGQEVRDAVAGACGVVWGGVVRSGGQEKTVQCIMHQSTARSPLLEVEAVLGLAQGVAAVGEEEEVVGLPRRDQGVDEPRRVPEVHVLVHLWCSLLLL